MSSTETVEHCIEVCNSLLRGELSAIETYTQAIDKFSGDPEVATLSRIRAEHEASAQRLSSNVVTMGGTPSTDSGAWGNFAKTVEGAAKLFGDTSALHGLQSGEEYGRGNYESALEDENVMPDCKSMISGELLPRQLEHIRTLKMLKDAQ
ncbi:hypothetical protein BH23VER1_BH23VER1_25120 [soil metagenome]